MKERKEGNNIVERLGRKAWRISIFGREIGRQLSFSLEYLVYSYEVPGSRLTTMLEKSNTWYLRRVPLPALGHQVLLFNTRYHIYTYQAVNISIGNLRKIRTSSASLFSRKTGTCMPRPYHVPATGYPYIYTWYVNIGAENSLSRRLLLIHYFAAISRRRFSNNPLFLSRSSH